MQAVPSLEARRYGLILMGKPRLIFNTDFEAIGPELLLFIQVLTYVYEQSGEVATREYLKEVERVNCLTPGKLTIFLNRIKSRA